MIRTEVFEPGTMPEPISATELGDPSLVTEKEDHRHSTGVQEMAHGMDVLDVVVRYKDGHVVRYTALPYDDTEPEE